MTIITDDILSAFSLEELEAGLERIREEESFLSEGVGNLLYNNGVVACEDGDLVKAFNYFERAAEIYPDNQKYQWKYEEVRGSLQQKLRDSRGKSLSYVKVIDY